MTVIEQRSKIPLKAASEIIRDKKINVIGHIPGLLYTTGLKNVLVCLSVLLTINLLNIMSFF